MANTFNTKNNYCYFYGWSFELSTLTDTPDAPAVHSDFLNVLIIRSMISNMLIAKFT